MVRQIIKETKSDRFYEKNGFVAFDKHIFRFGDDDQVDVMMRRELELLTNSRQSYMSSARPDSGGAILFS